jgi:hypothetical protein
MILTYNQYSDVLIGLNLKPVVQGLVGCSKSQTKARCLDKVERLRFVGAVEFVDELILCITALASCRSNPRDVVAGLEEFALGADFQNSPSTIVPNDVEAFGCKLVVILSQLVTEWYHSGCLTWCVIVGASPDLGVDWINRASLDPNNLVNEARERS